MSSFALPYTSQEPSIPFGNGMGDYPWLMALSNHLLLTSEPSVATAMCRTGTSACTRRVQPDGVGVNGYHGWLPRGSNY